MFAFLLPSFPEVAAKLNITAGKKYLWTFL